MKSFKMVSGDHSIWAGQEPGKLLCWIWKLNLLCILVLRLRTVPKHLLTWSAMTKCAWLVKLCDVVQSHHFGIYTCRFSIFQFIICLLKMSSCYGGSWKDLKIPGLGLLISSLVIFSSQDTIRASFEKCWELFCLILVWNWAAVMSEQPICYLSLLSKHFFLLVVDIWDSYISLT